MSPSSSPSLPDCDLQQHNVDQPQQSPGQFLQYSDKWDRIYAFAEEEEASCTGLMYPKAGYGSNNENESFPRLELCKDGIAYHGKEELNLDSGPDNHEDDDAYPSHSECEVQYHGEGSEHANMVEKNTSKSQDCEQGVVVNANNKDCEMEDALSGVYDVGELLKNQQGRGVEGDKRELGGGDVLKFMFPKKWEIMPETTAQVNEKVKDMKGSTHIEGFREVDVTCDVPYVGIRNPDGKHDYSFTPADIRLYRQVMHKISSSEQADMKKHLKSWAYVVASAAHSKASMRAKKVHTK